MHPSKFLGRAAESVRPAMSEAERAERLQDLGNVIATKRKEAIDARKASGIEDVWMACEEAYLGIDDMNRGDFANARWAKPTSMSGGLTSSAVRSDPTRSNAFVRLTARYVDNASAKLGEILFPIDDKAFSFEPTPDPDLVRIAEAAQPVVQMAPPPQYGAPSPEAMAQPAQGMPQAPAEQAISADMANEADKIVKAAIERAKKAETRIYDWMVEAKYPAEGRKIVHDAARIGVGILKGPFPDIQENRAMTRKEGVVGIEIQKKVVPSVCWIDPWNFFPEDGCGEDIHNGDGIFERDFLSNKKLKKLKEHEGYLKEQIDQVIAEGPDKCNVEGSNPSDKNNKKRFPVWYYHGTLKREELALANAVGIEDIPEDQEEVSAIVSLVNDTVIRAIIHPLDSGKFPYRVVTWSRRAGHWAGVGVGEQMSMPQRMVNASTRALLNNAGVASGVQIVISKEGIIPADTSYRITPNKVWYATGDAQDVTKAFQVFKIPSIQVELSAIIEYSMKLAEESTGIPLITQGQTGPTSPDTFGQAELQDNNAHTWLRSIGYRFDDQITEPLVQDFYEWLLLDEKVPDDEKGDFRINAHGSIAMVERAIQEQMLFGLLNAAMNPAFKTEFKGDPAKLFALVLKSKRFDPREIQYSEEEQAKIDAQPVPPPLPIAVEQVKGQNALQAIDAKAKAEIVVSQQEAALDAQAAQNGGTPSPQMVAAQAGVERERIRADSLREAEANKANIEQARADREMLLAQGDREFEVWRLNQEREIELMRLARDMKISISDAKVLLAKSTMAENTKRDLAAAEIDLAMSEGQQDRTHDMDKHTTSLIRDEISTPNTP